MLIEDAARFPAIELNGPPRYAETQFVNWSVAAGAAALESARGAQAGAGEPTGRS